MTFPKDFVDVWASPFSEPSLNGAPAVDAKKRALDPVAVPREVQYTFQALLYSGPFFAFEVSFFVEEVFAVDEVLQKKQI